MVDEMSHSFLLVTMKHTQEKPESESRFTFTE